MVLLVKRFYILFALLGTFATTVRAETWLASPANGQWNNNGNWDLGTWPNGSSASATFGSSSTTAVSLVAGATVGNILFNGGSQFRISTDGNTLDVQGNGINNTSGSAQTIWNNGGDLLFRNNAQAVSAVLVNDPLSSVIFYDTSSSGTALIQNSGILTFQDNSSAAGATIVTTNGGQVSFSGNAAGGQAQLSLASGSFLFLDYSTAGAVTVGSIDGGGEIDLGSNNLTLGINGLSTTISGTISDVGFGGGSLTKNGLGTLTLTGNNVFSGGTSILSGEILLAGGTLGSGPVVNQGTLDYALTTTAVNHVTNNGNLLFQDNATAGSATLTNNSALYFNGSSSAVSALVYNFGTLSFTNSSTAANAAITNSGLVHFLNGSTAANAAISNTGAIYFLGDSTGTMASAGNAVIDDGDLVQFEDYSTAGNSHITVENASALNFTGTAQGGTAQIALNSGGTLNIAAETSAGVTLALLNGASGGLVQLGANNLVLNGSLSSSIGATISGSGSLTKLGSGVLILSGSNNFSGGTQMLGGQLVVGNSNALGTGTLNLQNGTLVTNGSPITVNMGGNYNQASGGTLQLGLGGTSSGQWDLLNVTGSANLGGALSVYADNGFTPAIGDSFAIFLIGGTLTGNFTSLTDPIAGTRFLPFYKAHEVDLVAIQPSFTALASTFNQKAVAAAMDASVLDPNQQSLMLSLGTASVSTLPAAYDQISPAGLTPLFHMGFNLAQDRFGFVEQRVGALWEMMDSNPKDRVWRNGQGRMLASTMDPALESGLMGNGSAPERWGGFTRGLGSLGTVTGDGNGPGYQFFTGGMSVGVDDRMERNLVGGILVGYSQSGTSQASDSVQASGGQVGFYGGWRSGDLKIDGLLDGGINNYNTTRGSYGGSATGTARGMQYGLQLGAGFDWNLGGLTLGPLASGHMTHVQVDNFAESGSTALNFPAQGQDELASELGFQAKLAGTSFEPSVKAVWEHLYQGNLDQITASLPNSSNSFLVEGPALGADGFLVSAGIQMGLGKGMAAQLAYEGVLGMTNFDSQNFSGGISLDL